MLPGGLFFHLVLPHSPGSQVQTGFHIKKGDMTWHGVCAESPVVFGGHRWSPWLDEQLTRSFRAQFSHHLIFSEESLSWTLDFNYFDRSGGVLAALACSLISVRDPIAGRFYYSQTQIPNNPKCSSEHKGSEPSVSIRSSRTASLC